MKLFLEVQSFPLFITAFSGYYLLLWLEFVQIYTVAFVAISSVVEIITIFGVSITASHDKFMIFEFKQTLNADRNTITASEAEI